MRGALIAALMCSIALPASAEWKTGVNRDPMTDKSTVYAIAPAKEPSQGVWGRIYAGCMNGAPAMSLDFGTDLTRGQIGTVFRFDDAPPQVVFMRVLTDPKSIPLLSISPRQFVGKKRFRMQISPTGGEAMFWDFDVSGFGPILKQIRC